MEYDSRKLRIEFHKADALRELRPHLDARRGKGLEALSTRSKLKPRVVRYLSRIVYAHLEALLESYPLPPDADIDALTDKALHDAKEQVNSTVVDQIAGVARIYLVDMARVTYLSALTSRTRPASPSRFGALDHDPEYEKWTRQACEGFQSGFRAQDENQPGSSDHPVGSSTRSSRRRIGKFVGVNRKQLAKADNVERRMRERAEMLAAYKTETRVMSDRAIYGCAGKPGTHSCHKPQFIQWKNGKLSSKSQPCQSLEAFLKERRIPPSKLPLVRRNLPSLPRSTN